MKITFNNMDVDCDFEHDYLIFVAHVDGRRVPIRVAFYVLEQWCGADDTGRKNSEIDKVQAFNRNRKTFERIAEDMILKGITDEDGGATIDIDRARLDSSAFETSISLAS